MYAVDSVPQASGIRRRKDAKHVELARGAGWGSFSGFRQPDTLLAWHDYTVRKTAACREAMVISNTTLLFLPEGLTPRVRPCEEPVNKLFKSNVTALYDEHMTAPNIKRDDRGYPEPASRG